MDKKEFELDLGWELSIEPVLCIPSIDKIILNLRYLTISNYAIRIFCSMMGVTGQEDAMTIEIYEKWDKRFVSLISTGIKSKFIEMGFSRNALDLDWDSMEFFGLFSEQGVGYIKIGSNNGLFLRECDPYYRWAING